MSVTIENPAGATAVRPFTITKVPEAELEALRARIEATRWPDKETVTDDSQGVPLAMLQELARYWATEYDWRKCEAKLNALPNFNQPSQGGHFAAWEQPQIFSEEVRAGLRPLRK